jgi:hypothetical protein
LGNEAFDYLRSNPAEASVVDDAMTAISTLWAPAIAAAYDSGRWGTVTDVGGGSGLLLGGDSQGSSQGSWRSGGRSVGAGARPPARFLSGALADRVRFEPSNFLKPFLQEAEPI